MTRKMYVALNTQIAHYHIQESRAAVLLQQEAFVPIDPVNMRTKFEVRSFTSSWDNRGTPKIIGQSLDVHCVQKKNTHSYFLSYLRGKCLDLHKIFRVCL